MTVLEAEPEAHEREERYEKAVTFAAFLALQEAQKSEDNHGGELLHRSIPFGD